MTGQNPHTTGRYVEQPSKAHLDPEIVRLLERAERLLDYAHWLETRWHNLVLQGSVGYGNWPGSDDETRVMHARRLAQRCFKRARRLGADATEERPLLSVVRDLVHLADIAARRAAGGAA